jgi:hypothetical protein
VTRAGLPQVWRIPPWQAAALLLLTTVLAAVDLYARPSVVPMLVAAFVAVMALFAAVGAIRFLLVADEDGIWVRRLFTVTLVGWADIERVEMASAHRGGMTVRITRRDGTCVDVPPSLVLPAMPTTLPNARRLVQGVANELNSLAAARHV